MGEKYDALNQKGHVVVNQVEEKFCFQGEKTYCPTPFFWTDSGFGLYVDTCETTTFHFDENSVTIDLPESASVVTFSGEPAQIVSAYMLLKMLLSKPYPILKGIIAKLSLRICFYRV